MRHAHFIDLSFNSPNEKTLKKHTNIQTNTNTHTNPNQSYHLN